MVNKRASHLLLVAVLFVLSISLVSAFDYNVEMLNNTITRQEAALFKITISNNADYEDFFTISTRDVNWIVDTSPASGVIAANTDGEFLVELRPKPLVSEGKTYFIPVKIKSEKSGYYFEEQKEFAVYVVSPDLKAGVYPPTVTTTISIDKVVDPRDKLALKLNLWNRNPRDLKDLKVVVDGEIFSKEYTTKLLPLEDKTNEILFDIDPLAEPGKRTATVTLFFDNENIGESSTQYEIQGYSDLKETTSKQSFLFRTEEKFSSVNNGNDNGIVEKKFSIGLLKRLFTSFSPEAVKEKGDDGKTYYMIRKDLAPKEKIDITLVTSYRLPVLIILLILAGIVLYYVLRTPLIIIKSAQPLGKTEEGMNEVKVNIYLKNRSRKQLSNMRVVDIIPSIAEIEKKTRLGSMDPVNIGKSVKGTIAKWEINTLEPFEERIITYRIKSMLTLIGGINLPSAKARFEAEQGKERVTHSNSIDLVHKEE